MRKILFIAIGVLLLFSCNTTKFEKAIWCKDDGMDEYADRNRMIDDLLQNHKIKGLSYAQLVDSLCEPSGMENDNVAYYNILIKYGVIDPVYVKTLIVIMNKDSIVTDYRIHEHKRQNY